MSDCSFRVMRQSTRGHGGVKSISRKGYKDAQTEKQGAPMPMTN